MVEKRSTSESLTRECGGGDSNLQESVQKKLGSSESDLLPCDLCWFAGKSKVKAVESPPPQAAAAVVILLMSRTLNASLRL